VSTLCQVCKKLTPDVDAIPGRLVHRSIAQMIQRQHNHWDEDGYICVTDLARYRISQAMDLLQAEKFQIRMLREDLSNVLQRSEVTAQAAVRQFDPRPTLDARISDWLADFGGSWRFIFIFAGIVTVWVALNVGFLIRWSFDPFPFILLNLILSSLAALQAPVIMMSQKRQEARDRLRAEHAFKTNLKTEMEIRLLHEKVDYLMTKQWQRLLEVQRIQLEALEHFGPITGQQTGDAGRGHGQPRAS
jgi:uncharacterized membrane protein